ncbi:MAG: hydantoinase/oxoprolinase family protein [Chloroflexota bacterium]|nr:hydantoinase/oxoprolinase family protein [Chloroflexota bacterium]
MQGSTNKGYIVGVDVGGTFTDVVLADESMNQIWTLKTPSTLSDQSLGFIEGIRQIAHTAGVSVPELVRIFHGTTVATNAILQEVEPRIGLITTQGFRDVFEIGRHDVPRRTDVWGWVKPKRPVPPRFIVEVSERVGMEGEVLTPLDEESCRTAVRQLRDQGVQGIAVSFLYSFLMPDHEQKVAKIIAEEYPGAFISLSSEVLPQFREFERTAATILNAMVMPYVSQYVDRIETRLKDHNINAPLLIMKSNGGVTSAGTASSQAIQTVLSGPVAGVKGALEVAKSAGFDNFISMDVGGTSADICLVRHGVPEVTTERQIAGLPLQIPMLDITTVGAGGGSIARVAASGSLTVGPESAGAVPGPACYGLGGLNATVTDAHLVLGNLPQNLLGGKLTLDRSLAEQTIQRNVADPLGLTVLNASAGILAIANNNMAGAIRAISIGRGFDPSDFALVVFGGAGPLHATAVASMLGIRTVIIPPIPGVLSTYGLLFSDLQNDYVQTIVLEGPVFDLRKIQRAFQKLEKDAVNWLVFEGVPTDKHILSRSADLRYAHQGWEVTVPMPDRPLTQTVVDDLISAFHEAHQRLYTYALPDTPVELVNLRVTARGQLPRTEISPRSVEPHVVAGVNEGPVYFGPEFGNVQTAHYQRESLQLGGALSGPALVLQDDTTTLLAPTQIATIDHSGNLVIRLNG